VNALKKIVVVFAILVCSLVIFAVFSSLILGSDPAPFYVGVTYCGESVEEAKLLIDKVKDYTNAFFLQSGTLQHNPENITEIGDYAVSSELSFGVSFGAASSIRMKDWLDTYDGHWGDDFLGIYLGDEPAGKMIDGEMGFYNHTTHDSIKKLSDGSILCQRLDRNSTTYTKYCSDGRIVIDIAKTGVELPADEENLQAVIVNRYTRVSYYPNGTMTAKIREDSNLVLNNQSVIVTSPDGSVIIPLDEYDASPFQLVDDYNFTFTYEQLWNARPLQSYDETAERFIEQCSFAMNRYGPSDFVYFTSDYALHWFDYKSGYDVVLAQFGWNHTLAQDVALVRGAAELQNKSWGVIVTWKYTDSPYLDTGDAIYDQMLMAYEAGAEYILLFNYAEDMQGPYGTLNEEHFITLEQFWNNVVKSPNVTHGSTKAEAVLVLPQNYGWAMRNPNDKIWGLWGPDEKSQQIWELSRDLLEQYGTGLDIVYDDPQFPVESNYPQIYYWNQTG